MAGPLIRRGALFVGALVVLLVLLALAYGARVAWAAHNGVAGTDGTRTGIPVDAPVTIARDERAALTAFADGVNAAAEHEPAPPEYAFLFAAFERWQPEDALAVGFATVLDLDDRPDDVVVRDRIHRALGNAGINAFYPLTDPKYDVPTNGRPPGPIAKLPPLKLRPQPSDVILSLSNGAMTPAEERAPIGSNGWIVGADRSTNGRALLANDPHLDIGVPGIWYLLEGSAPGMHIGGAALAGTPGVTLGHNEHLAWGVTAGETAAVTPHA